MTSSKPFIRLSLPPLSWALLAAALLLSPTARAAGAGQQFYTCGMHPQIIKKEPGNCPICGMKLTPIRGNAAAAAGERKIKYYKSTMMPGEVSPKPGKDSMGMDMVPVYEGEDASAAAIHIDAGTIQRMNIKTGVVTRGPVSREIRNVGVVAYDERGLRDITTKYEGWLEKLFVDATWTAVRTGEPLFEIYSPDLYNAQLNYLVARRTEADAGGPLTRAALARLQLFDVADDFIAELQRTGEARRTYIYRAPADGIVVEKMAVAGQMMKPGERIYRLADLSTVWVHAQIYENDLPFVHVGQTVTVRATYGRDRDIPGEVALLFPQVEEQTRTATARIVLPNPGTSLRPGMFVDVRLSAQLADSAVLVPEMAVLRSGERNTVFVALDDGSFEPREVTLGARSADRHYEVLSGLVEGERVVTSGQFMLDSESQLREAIQKMLKGFGAAPGDAPTGHEHTEAAGAASDGGRDGPPGRPSQIGAPGGHALPDIALLAPLAFALADASAVLAADDLAGHQKQLPVLNAALAAWFEADPHAGHGPLAVFKAGLPDRADLKSARRDFAPFSTAVTDLARANHVPDREKLHVFECPMPPVVGKGRWLQRTGELRNPFFGSAMLTCGEEIDAPPRAPGADRQGRVKTATTEGEALLAYLRTQNRQGHGAGAEDGCAGCGMSMAAMAAGQPCEHEK